MKQFVMSMYATKEDLYKEKAAYWEAVAMRCIQRLQEIGEVSDCDDNNFYWESCGEQLDEGL